MEELTKEKKPIKTIGNKRKSSIQLSCKTLPYQDRPKHAHHISSKLYKRIMETYFKRIVYYMIKDGTRYTMPQGLGDLQIIRYDYDKRVKQAMEANPGVKSGVIDYNATNQLKKKGINKTIYHRAKKTGGYWWKIHWFKTDCARFKTQRIWKFKFTRPNIRPNSYNPKNPELSIVPYFNDRGWEIYSELPINKRLQEYKRKYDKSKTSST